MAPTIILFKGGVKEDMWKAGLDLMLPAELSEIHQIPRFSRENHWNFDNHIGNHCLQHRFGGAFFWK